MPLDGYESLCEERQKIIVSRDKGQQRKHRARNIRDCKVTHYQIDGCVIKGAGNKCDFLLMNEDDKAAYLIELKGEEIKHAVKQLEETAERLKRELNPYTVRYRLVHTKARTHDINSNEFKKFCRRHAKKGEFIKAENILEEDI